MILLSLSRPPTNNRPLSTRRLRWLASRCENLQLLCSLVEISRISRWARLKRPAAHKERRRGGEGRGGLNTVYVQKQTGRGRGEYFPWRAHSLFDRSMLGNWIRGFYTWPRVVYSTILLSPYRAVAEGKGVRAGCRETSVKGGWKRCWRGRERSGTKAGEGEREKERDGRKRAKDGKASLHSMCSAVPGFYSGGRN